MWGSGGIAPPFLISALDGREWPASRPGRIASGETAPGTHPLNRRLGGPQSRSGRCGEEKNLALAVNQTPAIQPVSRRYTD
jgi:hypothetical protein